MLRKLAKLLNRRAARSLLRLLQEQTRMTKILDIEDLAALLRHPSISTEAKKKIIAEISARSRENPYIWYELLDLLGRGGSV